MVPLALQFQVTRRFSEGADKLIAAFADETKALEFMNAQIAWDHKTKVNTVYKLFSNSDLLKTVNSQEFESVESAEQHASESRDQHSNLSPFNTSPRPPGTIPGKKPRSHDYEDEQ